MSDSNPIAESTVDSHAHAKKAWYVVQVYSGMEKNVQRLLQERIEQAGLSNQFSRILVPSEEVMETKDGRNIVTERLLYRGYVFIEMEMNDETWHFVNATKNVIGFVSESRKGASASGSSRKGKVSFNAGRPSSVSEAEINNVLSQTKGKAPPRPKKEFRVGEIVRIKREPFEDFNGTIDEVNYEKSRLKVSVMIFERATPVELEFDQVEKISEYN